MFVIVGPHPVRCVVLSLCDPDRWDISRTIEHLSLHCKENKDRDGYAEFYLDIERHVDDIIKLVGIENRDVTVADAPFMTGK